ncbi:MAG: hypothetical protein M1831_002479 [Alyxoria varia]|nr:MAG: hypothetical protein M1831_002479 [Alyxoria varia]
MPKRSTGCYKCRQRKVKCDERKPDCQRCIDLGIECPGYRPAGGYEFKDQTQRYAQNLQSMDPEHQPRRSPTSRNAPSESVFQSASQGQSASTEERSVTPETKSSLHRAFLEQYLPKNEDQSLVSHYSYLWMLPMANYSPESALETALDAVSLVHFGTRTGNSDHLDQSRHLYGIALQRLGQEISQPGVEQSIETLCAIQLLTICEQFRATSTYYGCMTHTEGAKNFLETGDCPYQESRIGQLLFFSHRDAMIEQALVQNNVPSFQLQFWMHHAASVVDDEFVKLTNILLDVAQSLQYSSSFVADTTAVPQPDEAKNVFDHLSNLLSQLRQWYGNFQNANGQPFALVPIEQFPQFCRAVPNDAISEALDFRSFHDACLMSRYYVAAGLICRRIGDLLAYVRQYITIPQSEDPVTYHSKARNCALRACQSIPYSWKQEVCGTVGKTYSTFPLWFAQQVFQDSGPASHSSWCSQVESRLCAMGIVTLFTSQFDQTGQ